MTDPPLPAALLASALADRAHDVRHDRKVALNLLRPELSAILGAQRFLAEIKTTATRLRQ